MSMDKRKYVVQVIDNDTNLQVQRSFAHVWAECEELYVEYQEEFDGCSVTIIPATEEDLKKGE